jgi:hypothetical protein
LRRVTQPPHIAGPLVVSFSPPDNLEFMIKSLLKKISIGLLLLNSLNTVAQNSTLTIYNHSDSLVKINPYLSENTKAIVVIEDDTLDFETFKKLDLKKYDIVSYRLFQKKKSIRRFGDHGQDCVLLIKTRKNKTKIKPNH